ncbi:HNH endonuclease signature motif containing protein [Gemmobacter sp. 24YEA27]|uniref:HNH endonuclease signature motif containing protein n=1 Tax=Gemmobacter sp. 24YEA27 TaxID=3040672 RepID=UPI0024B34F05|nr:HNH endonuclease signature motif containing protein [Gemmobacter sp. 24YEA27]
MSGPSEKTVRRLFALSGNACAFPDCPSPIVEAEGTITGEICHVRAQSKGGPRYGASQTEQERHAFENLLLLCRRHHKIIDTEPDIYSVEVLEEMKAVQETRFGRLEQASDGIFAKLLLNAKRVVEITNNSGSIVVDSPGAIVGRTINVSTSRKAVHVHPAAGTIGADQNASRYIQHLISRYNEFASKEPTRASKFNYGAISKNIEHKFGAQWKLLPMSAFADLCTYLQTRIDKTRLAKLNKSNGHSSYSSFTKYTQGMQSRMER